MPHSVAQYLRHLAVRCTRLARDGYDSAVSKELEVISTELVEQAQYLEAHYALSEPQSEVGEPGGLKTHSCP
jgi:hypothetical protein